ncbi:hypothetical protein EBI_27297 [Enterocytozoon bieneusi H348]|nr:hypothetical protein EBI_27297 [Enterocytozoon bieneusi H348]|eukprot:XP_002652293.1 hypothetical protein EBI_27297 [Enterocytozoon bieneusi H348]
MADGLQSHVDAGALDLRMDTQLVERSRERTVRRLDQQPIRADVRAKDRVEAVLHAVPTRGLIGDAGRAVHAHGDSPDAQRKQVDQVVERVTLGFKVADHEP